MPNSFPTLNVDSPTFFKSPSPSYPEPYPAPFLSASPSTVVNVGENITIICKSDNDTRVEFHLFKNWTFSRSAVEKEEENEVAFCIANATRSDGGIYRCTYCLSTQFSELCSHYSNGERIFIRGKSPSAIFTNVTICIGPREESEGGGA